MPDTPSNGRQRLSVAAKVAVVMGSAPVAAGSGGLHESRAGGRHSVGQPAGDPTEASRLLGCTFACSRSAARLLWLNEAWSATLRSKSTRTCR